jgi:hypothetical protein
MVCQHLTWCTSTLNYALTTRTAPQSHEKHSGTLHRIPQTHTGHQQAKQGTMPAMAHPCPRQCTITLHSVPSPHMTHQCPERCPMCSLWHTSVCHSALPTLHAHHGAPPAFATQHSLWPPDTGHWDDDHGHLHCNGQKRRLQGMPLPFLFFCSWLFLLLFTSSPSGTNAHNCQSMHFATLLQHVFTHCSPVMNLG